MYANVYGTPLFPYHIFGQEAIAEMRKLTKGDPITAIEPLFTT